MVGSPIKHDVVWKEGREEQLDDSNGEPQHQQNYGAKNHLEDAEKDTAAVNIVHGPLPSMHLSSAAADLRSSHTQRWPFLTSGTELQRLKVVITKGTRRLTTERMNLRRCL